MVEVITELTILLASSLHCFCNSICVTTNLQHKVLLLCKFSIPLITIWIGCVRTISIYYYLPIPRIILYELSGHYGMQIVPIINSWTAMLLSTESRLCMPHNQCVSSTIPYNVIAIYIVARFGNSLTCWILQTSSDHTEWIFKVVDNGKRPYLTIRHHSQLYIVIWKWIMSETNP